MNTYSGVGVDLPVTASEVDEISGSRSWRLVTSRKYTIPVMASIIL